MEDLTNRGFKLAGVLLTVMLICVYFFQNPAQHFFPKCPVFWATGLKCPGCGAQRATHYLLHGNLESALQVNFLFVLALPYVLLGLGLEYTDWGKSRIELRRRWYGLRAAQVALLVIVAFTLARNIWGW